MDVKITSYNVHSCVGNDGIYSVDRIANVIRYGCADIVCLQEIEVVNDIPIQTRIWSTLHNDNQPSMIAKLTGLQYHVFVPAIWSRASSRYKECHDEVTNNDVSGNFNDDEWKGLCSASDTSNTQNRNDTGKFGIAILSRYPIVSIRIHHFKKYKHKTIRNCMACLMSLPNDTRIWVVNTHLGCHFIGREQHQQVNELVSFINSLETNHTKIAGVIVCGDMNSPPIYQSIKTLRRSRMLDTWKLNGQGVGGTFPSYTPIPCFRKLFRLDYIFLRESGRRRILCKLVYVQDDGSTHLASDHLPLIAVFCSWGLDIREDKV